MPNSRLLNLFSITFSLALVGACGYLLWKERGKERLELDPGDFFEEGSSDLRKGLVPHTKMLKASKVLIFPHYSGSSEEEELLAEDRGRSLAMWLIEEGLSPEKVKLKIGFVEGDKNVIEVKIFA